MMSNISPLISIVMPCFNSELFIQESIESVLSQSYKNFELIIVDDGSTDESHKIILKASNSNQHIKYYRMKNSGAAKARNIAIRKCNGKYIAFLDSDDYWDKDFLKNMLKELERTGLDLVYCGWQNVGLKGPPGEPYIPPDYCRENLTLKFLSGCLWPIHGVLFKKSILGSVGLFDENLTSCMDYDLWLRMSPHIKVKLVPSVLAYYRFHSLPSITKNKVRIAFNHLKVQKKFISANPNIIRKIGLNTVDKIVQEGLLKNGYTSYWERDLVPARKIFRKALSLRYGTRKDLKYMLPSLIPLSLHKKLINLSDKISRSN